MIINQHLIPGLSKQSREAITTISDYLNSDGIGFELLVQSVEGEIVRLCAWNPHKQRAEMAVWSDLKLINEKLKINKRILRTEPGFISGVALADMPAGKILATNELEPETVN